MKKRFLLFIAVVVVLSLVFIGNGKKDEKEAPAEEMVEEAIARIPTYAPKWTDTTFQTRASPFWSCSHGLRRCRFIASTSFPTGIT